MKMKKSLCLITHKGIRIKSHLRLSHLRVWDGRLPLETAVPAGKLYRCTSVNKLLVVLKIPYMYYYITKLCRIQAEVIPNHVSPNVRGTGQAEAMQRYYKRLKLGGCKAYRRSSA
jgi:hypothetical protein